MINSRASTRRVPVWGMHRAHIIHAYIALHKSGKPDYILLIGSETVRTGNQTLPNAATEERIGELVRSPGMMPKDPKPRKGIDRIRSVALLLPASLRYDWQHSSSQLPININDARRTSSPGGRCCLRRTHGFSASSARFPERKQSACTNGIAGRPLRVRMGILHGRHSCRPLPWRKAASYMGIIARATISSLHVPDGIGGSPPPLGPPIETSNARRTSLSGGRCFLRCTHSWTRNGINLCGKARNLAGILPEFTLDMHVAHRCRAVRTLFISVAHTIFNINR